MVDIVVIGNVQPQTTAVLDVLARTDYTFARITDHDDLHWPEYNAFVPRLILVAGYRRLLPPWALALAPTVGFHSAKLPEYPGRAPVPWTLIRGDEYAYNTLLYLDEGVDTGDIIDERRIRVYPGDTPDVLYQHMARTCVEMLTEHLSGLLDGTAPRTPQDPALRGPLTTADGWDRLHG